MPPSRLIRNAWLVNEGAITETDVLCRHGRIDAIGPQLPHSADEVIDAAGQYLLPGVIDDQVHFREPGLTHKAEIATEARAAVAGGITSFMEMPNTKPPTLTQELLQQKYDRAAAVSPANYSFYMGVSNENLDEVLKTDPATVCGLKIFMGASTGNMLVDDERVLEQIFAQAPMLIATHCEDEATIRANIAAARERFGEDVPIEQHPVIRSREACYRSSAKAVRLARQHGARLHVLHISTADELALFDAATPLTEKRITAEACLHHLWFTDADYATLGPLIRWNPAVKTAADRDALWQALRDDRIDVVATDHAPHTLAEKQAPYFQAASGGPLVQHSLPALLDAAAAGRITLPDAVRKLCHAPADLFRLRERGYVREGYWADLVLVAPDRPWSVTRDNLRYKCGWSPFEGHRFQHQVTHTLVNGQLAYREGRVDDSVRGMRLGFN